MPEIQLHDTSPPDLVHLIVWHAVEKGYVLTPVRVVKFLYLADLYYARSHHGKTLTGWPWAFVHFGPYCTEAMNAIDESVQRGLVQANPYQSRYTDEERFVYSCDQEESPALESSLPNEVALPLRKAIYRWGEDTSGLLDYVYFATEPMGRARPGDRLDFELAGVPPARQPHVDPAPLSKANLRLARHLVDQLRQRVEAELRQQRTTWPSFIDDADSKAAVDSLDQPTSLVPTAIVAELGPLSPEPEDGD